MRGGPSIGATAALLLALGAPSLSWSADEVEQGRLIELRRLRAEVAGQIQLSVFDLLDELVYGWTQAPPFASDTFVFVADVSVPVGLGTGLEALLENHISALLLANPSTRVRLSHCPSCTATIVHSGPDGTVVSRGLDNPEALAQVGGPGGRHGLHIDVSAEGASLVLRARITELTPDLPIVWSRTLSKSAGAPSLLRSPQSLKSAQEARQEYLDLLQGRGPFAVPVRFVVRTYAAKEEFDFGGDGASVPPPPILWLQTGFDLSLGQARKWSASLVLGYAWLPDAYEGFMVQSRMSRLLTGSASSLTRPDLYLFVGGAVMSLDGPAIIPFETGDITTLLQQANNSDSVRATFGGWHVGLEMRMGNRIGAAAFLEAMPGYDSDDSLGVIVDSVFEFRSFGTEVTLRF